MNVIMFAIFASWRATVAQYEEGQGQENDLFRIEYYNGLRQNAVVKIRYTRRIAAWPRQPQYCYGALVDFNVAIVPCSCVAYRNDGEMASPWHQASHSDTVHPLATRSIMVGLMGDEHSPKEKTNEVGVDKIILHSKCDATFQVDYALLGLANKLRRARLAWVNSPETDELKKQLRGVSIQSAVDGQCIVMRWFKNSAWSVEESTVNFQMWNMCEELVCPEKTPQGDRYEPANFKQCLNKEVTGQRSCLTMTPVEVPLCNFVPGSPVFCEVGGFHGIVGLLTNFTTNCNSSESSNGIMASFDDAMDLARPYLRVRASSYFSSLRIYLRDPEY